MEMTAITSNDRQLRRYARFRQKTLAEFEHALWVTLMQAQV